MEYAAQNQSDIENGHVEIILEDLTEDDLALAFAEEHKRNLRHFHTRGSWFAWTGTIALINSRLSGSTKWFTSADPVHGGILIAVLEGIEGRPRFERLTNPPSGARDGLHYRLGYAFRALCRNYKALTYNAGS